MTPLEKSARAIARVMNGSIAPEIGMADDIPITPEDIYAALAALTALEPDEEMIINIAKQIADTPAMSGLAIGSILQTGDVERIVRASITAMLQSAINRKGER